MTTRRKGPYPSWECSEEDLHSIEGVYDLRTKVKYGLKKLYSGITQSMWRWDGLDKDDRLKDAVTMSRDTVPEKGLYQNGELCAFEYGSQIYILPMVYKGGLNLYGYMDKWGPMPYGWSVNDGRPAPEAWSKIMQLELDSSNSVVLRNDRYGTGDDQFIDKMVDLLVENILDTSQLQLLASNPIIFNVTPENLLTAKSVYLRMAEHVPVIYTNLNGEKAVPQTEPLGVTIDPSLFEIFDRFECNLLSYLGFPCVPITKRAQQSVSEVQSNDDKVMIRRMEKLHQREMACQRMNELFGTNLSVVSIIDEMKQQMQEQAQQEQEDMRGDDNVQETR